MLARMVRRLFYFEGYAPSRIDWMLGLPKGKARQIIVEYWIYGNATD